MARREERSYWQYCGPQNLEKALNTLSGLISGVLADQVLRPEEIDAVKRWISMHSEVRQVHPYSELIPVLEAALEDGVFTEEEKADITWMCDRLSGDSPFYDQITRDLQRLQGMLGGIIADGEVSKEELDSLSDWLEDRDYLRFTWPYEEVYSIITAVLADGKVDKKEEKSVLAFFSEFLETETKRVINNPPVKINGRVTGVCAMDPEIEIPGKTFCFTGKSSRSKRTDIGDKVEALGGVYKNTVSKKIDYLVIGNDGNPCWAYACYGRKIEQAIELRKLGGSILLVHENDFWDAVADFE